MGAVLMIKSLSVRQSRITGHVSQFASHTLAAGLRRLGWYRRSSMYWMDSYPALLAYTGAD
jgi:hypothetical protein